MKLRRKREIRWVPLVVFLLCAFYSLSSAFAGNSEHENEIAVLKERIQGLTSSIHELRQENHSIQAHNQEITKDILIIKGLPSEADSTRTFTGRIESLEDKKGRIKIKGALLGIFQADVNHRNDDLAADGASNLPPLIPNRSGQGVKDRSVGAGSFDLYLEARVVENTKVAAALEANSPNQVYSPTLSNPNSNGTFSTHLNPQNIDVFNVLELYVESKWYHDKLTTTIGKIYLSNYFDFNKVAWNEHTQFLADDFVYNLTFATVMPFYTIGARASYEIGWGLTAQVAAASEDDSGDKLFNALFGIAELDYKTFFFFGREGNYRAYGYVRNIDEIDEQGNRTNRSSNPVGIGFNMDQKITDKLTVFARAGWNESRLADTTNTLGGTFPGVKASVSAGGQYQGLLPNRPDDILGGAWALSNPSDPPSALLPERPDNEYFMEFYYTYRISPTFRVGPTLQFVLHPNGDDDENWTTIFGGRANMEF